MCGGAGTRLDRGEKPLVGIDGRPMIDRVLDALGTARIDARYAATSPRVPKTARRLRELDGVTVIETDGDGYVADLTSVLEGEDVERPVLTVVSDLPLLEGEVVERTIDAHGSGALTVCVPAALKRRLGVSLDTTRNYGGRELAPTGLNVVGESDAETVHVSDDARLAVNVNRPRDLVIAEHLARREVTGDGS